MAILEIELSGEDQTCPRLKAQAEALPPGNENWTLQDALDYADSLPENLGRATVLASEAAFKKFWDRPEDEAAWRDM